MANSNEPKKETVRITVSPPPSTSATEAAESRGTVRIHLPTRPPANPPASPADSPSPARITMIPDPQSKPGVQMKRTQPLIDLPAMERPATTVNLTPAPGRGPAPRPQPRVDQIPMPLCWTLLAVSATILILQIWNYLS